MRQTLPVRRTLCVGLLALASWTPSSLSAQLEQFAHLVPRCRISDAECRDGVDSALFSLHGINETKLRRDHYDEAKLTELMASFDALSYMLSGRGFPVFRENPRPISERFALHLKGLALVQLGRDEEALRYLRNRDDEDAHLRLAVRYAVHGDDDDFYRELRRAATAYPNDDVFFALVSQYEAQGAGTDWLHRLLDIFEEWELFEMRDGRDSGSWSAYHREFIATLVNAQNSPAALRMLAGQGSRDEKEQANWDYMRSVAWLNQGVSLYSNSAGRTESFGIALDSAIANGERAKAAFAKWRLPLGPVCTVLVSATVARTEQPCDQELAGQCPQQCSQIGGSR